jgi:hypothetical protein
MRTIEARVKELLAMDLPAHVLSNALFGPTGLFNQIAHTEKERRQFSQTALFQQANSRITELQRVEISEARAELERKAKQRRKVAGKSRRKTHIPDPATPAMSARKVGISNTSKKYRKSG